MKKILFVCMGNICRSAAAEAVMKSFLEKRGEADGFFVDSAGIIDYHTGERADARMRSAAAARGYNVDSIARQVRREDFEKFDIIVAMDNSNVAALKRVAADAGQMAKIHKLTEFLSQEKRIKYKMDEVPDPYYGGLKGFELVLDMLEEAMPGIIGHLKG